VARGFKIFCKSVKDIAVFLSVSSGFSPNQNFLIFSLTD
jgi:hypothetical protein